MFKELILNKYKSLGSVSRGASWLLSEKILKLVIGLFVHALVARYLSPELFGKMGFIINVATVFLPVTLLGLEDIGVKKLVEKDSNCPQIISHILAIRFLAFIFVFILSSSFVFFFNPQMEFSQKIEAVVFCLIYNLVGIFYTFEIIFLSRLDNNPIFISRFTGYLIGTGLKILTVLKDLGFKALLATYIFEEVIAKIILMIRFFKTNKLLLCFPTKKELKEYIAPGIAIVAGTFFMLLDSKMGFYALERFATSRELGFFTAAHMLIELWVFVPLAIMSALLPSLISSYRKDPKEFYTKFDSIHAFFFLLQISFVASVWFLAPFIISYLYGPQYEGAEQILRWQAFTVFVSFSQLVRLRWFIVEGQVMTWTLMALAQLMINIYFSIVLKKGDNVFSLVLISFLSFHFINLVMSFKSQQVRRIYLSSLLIGQVGQRLSGK